MRKHAFMRYYFDSFWRLGLIYAPDCQKALITQCFHSLEFSSKKALPGCFFRLKSTGNKYTAFKCYWSIKRNIPCPLLLMNILFGMMKRIHTTSYEWIPYRCGHAVQTPGGAVLSQCSGLWCSLICNADAVRFASRHLCFPVVITIRL